MSNILKCKSIFSPLISYGPQPFRRKCIWQHCGITWRETRRKYNQSLRCIRLSFPTSKHCYYLQSLYLCALRVEWRRRKLCNSGFLGETFHFNVDMAVTPVISPNLPTYLPTIVLLGKASLHRYI